LPWPQFRGPQGDGHATARDLPLRWSETENVAWKSVLPGEGWSSPVVGNGRLWMTTATDEGLSLRALCVDAENGTVVHNVEVFRRQEAVPKNAKNGYASPTPVLDDRCVYVHFGTQGTACIDQVTGKVLWTNEQLVLDHKEGPGSSPVLWHDLLVVNCDGMDVQFVAALDKETGAIRWKTNRSGKMNDNPDFRKAYCTPLLITVDGHDELVSPGADRVIAYDPATGRELWKVEYKGFSNVSRPVRAHDLLLVTTSFVRPELWAIRTGGRDDATESHVVWKAKKQMASTPSPLVVGGELYVISDKGIFTCVDLKTGEEIFSERIGGNFSASPLTSDGKIYLFGEDGLGYVMQPGRSYQLLSENHLDGRILATPAIVNRALFVRTDRALYRVEKK
jgi:outer membrane protein assembly factor BamB